MQIVIICVDDVVVYQEHTIESDGKLLELREFQENSKKRNMPESITFTNISSNSLLDIRTYN